jgi:hypothetical protein
VYCSDCHFCNDKTVLRKEGAGEFLGNKQYVQMLRKISQEIKRSPEWRRCGLFMWNTYHRRSYHYEIL